MHKYQIQLAVIVALFMALTSCKKKEEEPVHVTNWDMDITQSTFSDTLYQISTLNVESTNTDIISLGTIQVTDENGTVICDDNWSQLLNHEFPLTERRHYVLTAILYDGQEPVDTQSFSIDNVKYPTHVEIIDFTVLNLDFNQFSDISDVHTSLLYVENRDWDAQIHEYYSDKYPPKETSFNQGSCVNGTTMKLQRILDYEVASCSGEGLACYDITTSYAKVIGTTVYGEQRLYFEVSMIDLVDESDMDFSKTYTYTIDPDYDSFSSGATLTYKLVYEN